MRDASTSSHLPRLNLGIIVELPKLVYLFYLFWDKCKSSS